jgi:hypothetical protein
MKCCLLVLSTPQRGENTRTSSKCVITLSAWSADGQEESSATSSKHAPKRIKLAIDPERERERERENSKEEEAAAAAPLTDTVVPSEEQSVLLLLLLLSVCWMRIETWLEQG